MSILLLAIAPIVWILPTPRQRQEGRLRQRAMQIGLRVQLDHLPKQNPSPEELIDGAGRALHPTLACARYALSIKQDTALQQPGYFVIFSPGKKHITLSDNRLPEGWLWRDENQTRPNLDDDKVEAISHCLTRLPQSTLALERTTHELAVFWRESGGDGDVDLILETLQKLEENS